jgi:hypothetical protein
LTRARVALAASLAVLAALLIWWSRRDRADVVPTGEVAVAARPGAARTAPLTDFTAARMSGRVLADPDGVPRREIETVRRCAHLAEPDPS